MIEDDFIACVDHVGALAEPCGSQVSYTGERKGNVALRFAVIDHLELYNCAFYTVRNKLRALNRNIFTRPLVIMFIRIWIVDKLISLVKTERLVCSLNCYLSVEAVH